AVGLDRPGGGGITGDAPVLADEGALGDPGELEGVRGEDDAHAARGHEVVKMQPIPQIESRISTVSRKSIRAPTGTVWNRPSIWKVSVPAAAAWMAWRVPQRQLPGADQVRGTHSDTQIDYTHDLSRRCLRVGSETSRTEAEHACRRLDRTAQRVE